MSEEKKSDAQIIQEMSVAEKLDRLHWFVTAVRRWVSENQSDFHKEIVESLQAQLEKVQAQLIKEVSDE
jgi:outer membrane PBP1 activator LpoA protein